MCPHVPCRVQLSSQAQPAAQFHETLVQVQRQGDLILMLGGFHAARWFPTGTLGLQAPPQHTPLLPVLSALLCPRGTWRPHFLKLCIPLRLLLARLSDTRLSCPSPAQSSKKIPVCVRSFEFRTGSGPTLSPWRCPFHSVNPRANSCTHGGMTSK